MGFSVSAATALLFIAGVITFASISGAFYAAEGQLSDAQNTYYNNSIDLKECNATVKAVDIVNDTITILNDGSITIDIFELNVLINGTLCTDDIVSRTIIGYQNSTIWAPQESLLIQLSCALSDARIEVILGDGITMYSEGA